MFGAVAVTGSNSHGTMNFEFEFEFNFVLSLGVYVCVFYVCKSTHETGFFASVKILMKKNLSEENKTNCLIKSWWYKVVFQILLNKMAI